MGILRRAEARGKELPPQLRQALEVQAGIILPCNEALAIGAYHINQRNEGIDLEGVSGALMATQNMQMQTFITLEAVAFAANQRDEVRGLGDCSAAICARPSVKQQTFVAVAVGAEYNCLTPWDTQQGRIFTPEGVSPTLAGADDGGGRNPAGLLFAAGVMAKGNGECTMTPETHGTLTSGGGQAGQGYPCVLTAGFCAGAAPTAGGIGYQEECSPTITGSPSGNMMPTVLCLNDQGGERMDIYEDTCGTLRSQMDGHPPLVLGSQQGGAELCEDLCPAITAAAGTSGNNQPVLFENHGIDSRYAGPLAVAPTMSARYGTGGNNVPLVSDQEPESFCIAGNIIDRETHNGGNGFGYQPDISYTLNTADRHAVFSQQRRDEYAENEVVSTQAARQHKDATDLVCEVAGLDCRNGCENGDLCGTLQSKDSGGYSINNVHPVRTGNLIRRLTPLECERLQGFPDGWTDVANGSDSARYKALGNSVAIPCVEFVMRGIAFCLMGSYENGGQ